MELLLITTTSTGNIMNFKIIGSDNMSAWECGNVALSLVTDLIQSKEFEKWLTEPTVKSKFNLMNLLHSFNIWSLKERYGEDKFWEDIDVEYIEMHVDPAQTYKTVGCYLYQCDYIPYEECPQLLKDLEQWYQDTHEEYYEEWDEYDWDIDAPYAWRNIIYPSEHFESVMFKRLLTGGVVLQGLGKDGWITGLTPTEDKIEMRNFSEGRVAIEWLKKHNYKIHEHSVIK